MQRAKIILIAGLIIPIISLAAITINNIYQIRIGKEVILPITGYDPRDLLAGHYLTYRIDYGVADICNGPDAQKWQTKEAYICLEPKQFSYTIPDNCEILIKGTCNYNNFDAGVQRFYASEYTAKLLENELLHGNASIALSITKNGKAYVKYLLLDGKQWQAK